MPREVTHEHTPAPEQLPENSDDMARLLRLALDKVAFLPFGLLVDRWRWKGFSGETLPDRYIRIWWDLVEKYEAVVGRAKRGSDLRLVACSVTPHPLPFRRCRDAPAFATAFFFCWHRSGCF